METCNCITSSEEKIINHIKEKNPTWVIEGGHYVNKALMSPDYDHYQLYFELTYEMSFPKVNGEMSKAKRKTVSITPSYCPFCGKSFKPLD